MKSRDLSALSADQANEFLTAVVAPRPVAWVSTVSAQGAPNLAPFSAFAPVCNAPPMLVFSAHRRPDGTPKRTVENILHGAAGKSGGFVVNLIEEAQLRVMVATSVEPSQRDLIKWPSTVGRLPSQRVAAPRVEGCRVALECELEWHRQLGEPAVADLILARIVHAWVDDSLGDLWDRVPDSGVRPEFRPIGAMEVEWYTNDEGLLYWPNPPSEGSTAR